jgi:sugar (pentulose or hexulose) kinase
LAQGACIIADFGKTLSKVSLWSEDGRLIDRVVRPTVQQKSPAYHALDVDDVGDWLIETLSRFAAYPVEAILPVAHGAAVVGLHAGQLAFPPLDYEQAVPEPILRDYQDQRNAFAVTGSPALPGGLNIGSQLHWLEHLHGPALQDVMLLPYAQYWAWLLSGEARSEVTSLGCHSDLCNPSASDFSPMAKERGWAAQFAPFAKVGDVIGTLRPELAAQTGLPASTRIYAGLHDSNAALLSARGFPEIADQDATVLSTGTWFVAMRSLGGSRAPAQGRFAKNAFDLTSLPEARDCLVNVDADGTPVPSARFMGGREIEALIEIDAHRIDIPDDQPALLAAVAGVVASGAMLLPSFAPGFGPFVGQQGRWVNQSQDWTARRAAACLYAALVTETSLSLIGTTRSLLVEGRFAQADVFVRALASLRPDRKVYTAPTQNDVSFGALRLINPDLRPSRGLNPVPPLDQDITGYAARWRELAG